MHDYISEKCDNICLWFSFKYSYTVQVFSQEILTRSSVGLVNERPWLLKEKLITEHKDIKLQFKQ